MSVLDAYTLLPDRLVEFNSQAANGDFEELSRVSAIAVAEGECIEDVLTFNIG